MEGWASITVSIHQSPKHFMTTCHAQPPTLLLPFSWENYFLGKNILALEMKTIFFLEMKKKTVFVGLVTWVVILWQPKLGSISHLVQIMKILKRRTTLSWRWCDDRLLQWQWWWSPSIIRLLFVPVFPLPKQTGYQEPVTNVPINPLNGFWVIVF